MRGKRGNMTHKPSVPPASQPPYPHHPAPHAANLQAGPRSAHICEESNEIQSSSRVTAFGAAIGIGSAAIVAALLYARSRKL
jgi:hypothetical protein